ncbi:hypothetical protein E8P82_14710 [Arthrobacter echini]|uniref:Uncharacterized protein n=1 Tax=Arthrobacter echini TaxID=1529066 RepID=A0A4S5DZX2_9MICC|nr:hypothetical protein [Arthrobacter echini]THJ64585.1 hypothetical protein E8P82_14710 [Arthrobacter echini]
MTPDGKPWDGVVPPEFLVFRDADWPGFQAWDRWDAWWGAAKVWAVGYLPGGVDELLDLMPEDPSRPWNVDDI